LECSPSVPGLFTGTPRWCHGSTWDTFRTHDAFCAMVPLVVSPSQAHGNSRRRRIPGCIQEFRRGVYTRVSSPRPNLRLNTHEYVIRASSQSSRQFNARHPAWNRYSSSVKPLSRVFTMLDALPCDRKIWSQGAVDKLRLVNWQRHRDMKRATWSLEEPPAARACSISQYRTSIQGVLERQFQSPFCCAGMP